jgi:hypothetical protein
MHIRAGLDVSGEEKNIFTLIGNLTLDRVARSLVTVPTELSRLRNVHSVGRVITKVTSEYIVVL